MTLSCSLRPRSFWLSMLLVALLPVLSCSEDEDFDEDLARFTPDEAPDPPVVQVRFDDLPDGTLKFDASGRRWTRNDLTWCLKDTTPDLSRAQIIGALEAAAAEWSRVTPLTLRRVDDCQGANLEVRFGIQEHGDNSPFDGPGQTLAHAYFPQDGRVHFDDDETWTLTQRSSGSNPIDLQTVALHELGHALGLRHSSVQGAVMHALYGGSRRRLTQDDVDGIQSIYGASSVNPDPNPLPPGDDHGDSPATATLVATPSSTPGNIALANDVDVFRFEAPRGGEAVIQSQGEIDTLCELRDRANALIKKDDDGGGGRNCRIAATLTPGEHFVQVRHYSATGIGPYILDLALTAPLSPILNQTLSPSPNPNPTPSQTLSPNRSRSRTPNQTPNPIRSLSPRPIATATASPTPRTGAGRRRAGPRPGKRGNGAAAPAGSGSTPSPSTTPTATASPTPRISAAARPPAPPYGARASTRAAPAVRSATEIDGSSSPHLRSRRDRQPRHQKITQ